MALIFTNMLIYLCRMKKLIFVVVVIVLLAIINNLVHSIYDIWNKQDLLTQAQNELSLQQKKNQQLKAGLSYVQSPSFINEEARNKLFLVKPGEQDILIPSQASGGQNQKIPQAQTPNWQQWLSLFF